MKKSGLVFAVFSLMTAVVGVASFSLLSGCSSTEVSSDDPDAVYRQAEEAFKDERYQLAIERYRDLKNRFPYSTRATDAELRIADAYFEQESFLEAESAYEVFRELHPTHPKGDYVQYRIGLSYYNQIPSNSARDLSAAYRAIDAFDTLIEKYPSSEFAAKAKEQSLEARKKLAEHEAYVADFYFRRQHYLSASYRYSALLKDFSGMGYDEEALLRLSQSFEKIQMHNKAKDAASRLISQFPSSAHRSEAEKLLESLKK